MWRINSRFLLLLLQTPTITDHHQDAAELLMLPLGLLRLLKPCKVKRFLATEDLSMGGLVTGSSGNQCGMKMLVENECCGEE